MMPLGNELPPKQTHWPRGSSIHTPQNNTEAFITGAQPWEVYTEIAAPYRGWGRAAGGLMGTRGGQCQGQMPEQD